MGVVVAEHRDGTEIIQRPHIAAGTIGRRALLLAVGLLVVCVFLVVIGILLFVQLRADAIAAAEFWVAMLVMAAGLVVFAVMALWELSSALPRRITVSPAAVAVRFATPLPPAFAIARNGGRELKAEMQFRVHHNYAQTRRDAGGYTTIKSRKPYVRCGSRWIGPMDAEDAEALAEAMNAALDKP